LLFSIRDVIFFLTFSLGDVPRVNGQLAVARAFGDKNLKAHLRVDPDVYCLLIQDADEFLILASDGLWKVLKSPIIHQETRLFCGFHFP
jgi:protein phosphatase 1L